MTIAELTSAIDQVIKSDFLEDIWVVGEIVGNPKPRSNGHSFFDLRDHGTASNKAAPKLPAKLWSNQRARIEAELAAAGAPALTEGLEVLVRGKVSYYAPFSEVGFIVSAVDPNYTLGKLASERRRIIEALTVEGLLRANATRVLPDVPLDLLLVTSQGSAAYNDFLSELGRSRYAFCVRTIDTRMQGRDAEPTIIKALEHSDALAAAGWPHVVTIVRGGGSSSDMLAFDSEAVARRVAAHQLPVVCGIGHEIDSSVLDEVAHTSRITPTATAQFLVERVATFEARLVEHSQTLASRAEQALAGRQALLLATANKLHRSVVDEITRARDRLSGSTSRLPLAVKHLIDSRDTAVTTAGTLLAERARSAISSARQRLEAHEKLVAASAPNRVLARGYSITRDAHGNIVRQPPPAGTRLVTTLAEGSTQSTVD